MLWSCMGILYNSKESIASWKMMVQNIFKTLRRSNSIEFLIHGVFLVFIHRFYWVKFNINKEIKFQLWEFILKKIHLVIDTVLFKYYNLFL